MCNEACITFGAKSLTKQEVEGKRVIDVGSLDVNGSLRQTVESLGPAEYVGVDIRQGPGVDVICRAEDIVERFGKESFDIVVSTELLEHVRDWRRVISNIKRVCKRSGVILITTRSYGFPEHDYPFDFWRYEIEDMKDIFSDCDIESLECDHLGPGVFVKVRKPNHFVENDLHDYRLYSMLVKERTERVPSELDYMKALEATILEKDRLIAQLNDTVKSREADAVEKDRLIAQLNDTVKSREVDILEKERRIRELRKTLEARSQELETIRQSLVFRALCSVTGNIDRMMPDGTRRGCFRKTVVRSLHVIMDQGIKRFISQAVDKVRRGELRIIEVRSSPSFWLSSRILDEKYAEWLESNEIGETEHPDELLRLGYDVIFFPIIDWDFRFQRPQQICVQFAENHHRVFYLRTNFETRRNRDETHVLVRDIRENIYEVQLTAESPLNIRTQEIEGKNLTSMARSIDELIKRFGIISAVCLVELPSWTPLVKNLRSKYGWKIVYDCLDLVRGFSTVDRKVASLEPELAEKSDLVLASSRFLYEENRLLNPSTILVRNAADFQHFHCEQQREDAAEVLKEIGVGDGVIIGYYGAIADWFDVNLVKDLALRRPIWNFILIGSTALSDVRPLRELRNVYLLEEQPYQSLPRFLRAFDVCILPFLRNPLTDATNPVKVYEYLSAGKPVVTIDLPELRELADFVHIAVNEDEFITKIEQAIAENGQSAREKRIDFARHNTWEARFATISDAVRELYPKATVIVVSYNNLDLLKLCLESIIAYTDYPNYDVVVVDNASKDGSVRYLKELHRKCPEVKILLENSNVGFARALNSGIGVSFGEYVALLNDDVLVTRGWLARLIQHLRDDPSIGLICPSTDFAGNEAMLEVSFSGISKLQEFAFELHRKNFGKVFAIRTVPMFCALMPRRLISEIGGLDERFDVGMFEDDDYSHRARLNGYRTVCAADVFVHHAGRASFKKLSEQRYREIFESNKRKLEEKWKMSWIPHSPSRKFD